ncbi:Zn-dependent oxidoreductase, NADPH:quinone reductase [Streptomyces lincolnensis]|uniref:Zn-dependent oxidoreductase, NADPH:quinone reductase n=1 Tax=Streptomyces lincolnensis TaxID=1915 RepID=A0A1B1MIG7_STRLN|nr:NADP-dependent oxidoreductase [Streptomyces lincolnensis]ANS68182.1 Zn-dependent oxidoreductase, NADPH:quinone reductase [Streptomyces lincolnensis]AXG53612.1 Zn-dependent oxidoreductase, NADPH:quinone reductase [Streptomyces lincolnensis]QMV09830.1 zinc-binding dehydrogenase [Streptomyces lincolnensis]
MTTAAPRTQVITQHRFGGPDVLEPAHRPRPVPAGDEILLRVRAAGVTPQDRQARSGTAPLYGDPPFTLGSDVSGVVEEVGAEVTGLRPGDEVFGRVDGGGYAVHLTAPARHFAVKPASLDHVRAAAVPTAALTAWQALIDIARIGPGTRVLIHAAAGGVGHVAVQLAKAEGAYVIGTARADDHTFLRDLGADEPVEDTADFDTVVQDVDVALDLLGGTHGPHSLSALRPKGLLLCAVPGDLGLSPEDVEGRGMRFAVVQPEPSAERLTKIAALLASDRIRVHVSAALPFAEVSKAHELGEGGGVRGALVLVMPD